MRYTRQDVRFVDEAAIVLKKTIHKSLDTSKQHHAFYESSIETMIENVSKMQKDEGIALGLLVLWEIAGRCQDLTVLTVNIFEEAVDQRDGYWKIPVAAQKTMARSGLVSTSTRKQVLEYCYKQNLTEHIWSRNANTLQ